MHVFELCSDRALRVLTHCNCRWSTATAFGIGVGGDPVICMNAGKIEEVTGG